MSKYGEILEDYERPEEDEGLKPIPALIIER
jgi:hypothetical protein